jgi:hypothetical protein
MAVYHQPISHFMLKAVTIYGTHETTKITRAEQLVERNSVHPQDVVGQF